MKNIKPIYLIVGAFILVIVILIFVIVNARVGNNISNAPVVKYNGATKVTSYNTSFDGATSSYTFYKLSFTITDSTPSTLTLKDTDFITIDPNGYLYRPMKDQFNPYTFSVTLNSNQTTNLTLGYVVSGKPGTLSLYNKNSSITESSSSFTL